MSLVDNQDDKHGGYLRPYLHSTPQDVNQKSADGAADQTHQMGHLSCASPLVSGGQSCFSALQAFKAESFLSLRCAFRAWAYRLP